MTMTKLSDSGMIVGYEVGDEELDSVLSGQVARAEEALSETREKVREIENSDHFTDEGKKARKKLVVEQARREIRSALNVQRLERLHRQIEGKEKALFDQSNRLEVEDMDEEDVRTLEQETRQLLREKAQQENGELEVYTTLLDAARNDDRITLRAAERAPDSFPVLSEERVRKVQEVHAHSVFPDHVEDLRTKRQAFSILQHNIAEARDSFRSMTGEDPVNSPVFSVHHSNGDVEDFELDGSPQEEPDSAEERAGEGGEPAEPVTA